MEEWREWRWSRLRGRDEGENEVALCGLALIVYYSYSPDMKHNQVCRPYLKSSIRHCRKQ